MHQDAFFVQSDSLSPTTLEPGGISFQSCGLKEGCRNGGRLDEPWKTTSNVLIWEWRVGIWISRIHRCMVAIFLNFLGFSWIFLLNFSQFCWSRGERYWTVGVSPSGVWWFPNIESSSVLRLTSATSLATASTRLWLCGWYCTIHTIMNLPNFYTTNALWVCNSSAPNRVLFRKRALVSNHLSLNACPSNRWRIFAFLFRWVELTSPPHIVASPLQKQNQQNRSAPTSTWASRGWSQSVSNSKDALKFLL